MRCLNEPIARLANAEDGCTGRFWEGRFKSQALLDESALAACLAYVDLNPIRAGMADTPETSDHTSIQRRIEDLKLTTDNAQPEQTSSSSPELFPFVGNPRQDLPKGLPFVFTEYLELVDWTGRIVREDNRGNIPADTPPILQRLHIEPDAWLQLATRFETDFCHLVGSVESVHEGLYSTRTQMGQRHILLQGGILTLNRASHHNKADQYTRHLFCYGQVCVAARIQKQICREQAALATMSPS